MGKGKKWEKAGEGEREEKEKERRRGEKVGPFSFVFSTYTSFRIYDHMLQGSSQVHTKCQVTNLNRILQQRFLHAYQLGVII